MGTETQKPETEPLIFFTDRLKYNLQNLQRIDQLIQRADEKSSIVAAANIGLLSILLALLAIVSGVLDSGVQITFGIILITIFVLYLLVSMASTVMALMALFPRLKSERKADSKSLFYFKFLSSYESELALTEVFDHLQKDQYLDAVEDQIYHVSRIASKKYGLLKAATILLIISGVLWTMIMGVLFIHLVLILME